ncbi:MAG: hypothetical protein JJT94_00070 [Bernardetiaceae bacterium]|nr:hypothetical protein [Bernardetiaceae bacterium]
MKKFRLFNEERYDESLDTKKRKQTGAFYTPVYIVLYAHSPLHYGK